MPYSQVDATIHNWAEAHKLTLNTEFNGPARFCYVTGGWCECFQIAVTVPNNGVMKIIASSVETDDDAELTAEWTVSPDELKPALQAALRQVRAWDSRPRFRISDWARGSRPSRLTRLLWAWRLRR